MFGSCVVAQIVRFGLGSAGSNTWYIYIPRIGLKGSGPAAIRPAQVQSAKR